VFQKFLTNHARVGTTHTFKRLLLLLLLLLFDSFSLHTSHIARVHRRKERQRALLKEEEKKKKWTFSGEGIYTSHAFKNREEREH
jgi:hypothetical protein